MTRGRIAPSLPLLALLAGCAGAPGGEPQVPRYAPEDQTSASAAKSASRPLILEWPAADRAALEAQRASGLVVVRYGEREIDVLRGCRVAATYRYVPITPKEEDLVLRDATALEAAMPIHSVTLEAKLEAKEQLEVAMTIVGMYQADPRSWSGPALQGDCAGATHVIQALTVGAFEIAASAQSSAAASARVMGMGGSASHDAQREVLHRDGSKQACESSGRGDASPPYHCGALLRVEVVPVRFAASASHACGPGLVARGGGCEAVAPDRPALLDALKASPK